MSTLKLVKDEPMDTISTIATSALLIELNISTWTGRKRDKNTTAEVTQRAQAGSSKAASVIKNLMSDDADLDKIKSYAQDCRNYIIKHTYDWNNGVRLLPSAYVFEVTSELEAREQQYTALVEKFLADYSVKISAAAFKLGSLFNRNEYPTVQEIRRKFKMSYFVSPVPLSGDFRVDVQNDTAAFLREKFKTDAEARIAEMMREPWERIYTQLANVRERVGALLEYEKVEGEGKKAPKLFQATIDNALEIAQMMDKMNVTGDLQLADCAARMRRLFANVDIKSVRESRDQQESIKKQVDDLIGAFDFSGFDMTEE
jgi:hypothetical protein